MRCVGGALTQSVSNLFVEFLLSEVERGEKGTEKAPPSSAEGDAPFDLNRLAQLDAPARGGGASTSAAPDGASLQP